jgi:hypothetical protein
MDSIGLHIGSIADAAFLPELSLERLSLGCCAG